MKAIVIDPVKREVAAIEIDLAQVVNAFGEGAVIQSSLLGNKCVIFHEPADEKKRKPDFYIRAHGFFQIIYGKGLLFDQGKSGSPKPTRLTVREVERCVRFSF